MPGGTQKYALPYMLPTEGLHTIANVTKLLAERLEALISGGAFKGNPGDKGDPGGINGPMASVVQNTAYAYASGSLFDLLNGGTVEYDKNSPGGAQASSNKLTVQKSGMYLVTAVCPWATNNASGHRVIKLVTLDAQGNGTTVGEDIRPGTTASLEQVSQLSVLLPLTVGTQLGLWVYQTSGATLTAGGTQQGAIKTRLAMQWVSPTA